MDAIPSKTPHVLVENRDNVRRIVLNRPAGRNLLTFEMIEALENALDAPGARVIVIASDGPAFCAGHDMKAMAAHHADEDGGKAYFAALFAACGAMMTKIATLPQPVIAEVHAPAVAAGCQLVAACDLAIAADTATFGTTGVAFGLYCSTPAVPLTRTVAPKHAAHMLMTGDLVDAAHAATIGLINEAVPPAALRGEVDRLANRIASHSGAVLAIGKRSVRETASLDLAPAYEKAADAMVENLLLPDGREGLAAFRDKRPANWRDLRADKAAFWDARYAGDEAAFGTAPNAFLAAVAPTLPKGRALAAADGQGRNALFLAGLGYETEMVDLSPVAVAQARASAEAAGLSLTATAGSLADVPLSGPYDLITLIYCHLPPDLRRPIHARLAEVLASGGMLVVEAFAPKQLELKKVHNSGGPSDPALLVGPEGLAEEFAGLTPTHLETTEVELDEGRFHQGRAAVVRAIFTK
ncbi:MAG: enoyl-CoA hydratase-related protein [Pseudomonadota bacterium]